MHIPTLVALNSCRLVFVASHLIGGNIDSPGNGQHVFCPYVLVPIG